MKKSVPFEGPLGAKLMLVGEAPGSNEEAQGRPFVGGAGKLLDKLLMNAGIARDECRIGNVCCERPAANKWENLTEEQIAIGTKHLLEDIERVQPNLILALGAHAMETLVGEDKIGLWRGSMFTSFTKGGKQIKVLPTYHPAGLMRNWDGMPLAAMDFKKAAKEMQFPELRRKTRETIINPTISEVWELLAQFNRAEKISFDIETNRPKEGQSIFITSIAIADSPNRALCIPFVDEDKTPYWDVGREIAILKALKQLLENPNVQKVAQNAQFDMGVLEWKFGIRVNPLHLDTMCGFHTLYSELPKGLDTLTSIYTDQPYYKNWSGKGFDMFQRYNGMDAMVTYECGERIEEDLKELGVWDFYLKHIAPLILVLLEMQLQGVRIDPALLEKAKEEVGGRLAKNEERLEKALDHSLNVNSNKQMVEFLYEEMGLPVKLNRRSKNPTADEETLRAFANKTQSPIFDLILAIRGDGKLLSTYLEAELKEGRMHTSYNIGGSLKMDGKLISGPESGRLSSSRSIVMCSGTNLQNVPEGICRQVFIPDEGKVWVKIDLDQAEARVVGYLAEDKGMMERFETGGDIHTFNASCIEGISEGEINADQRYEAKRSVHAWNYLESYRGYARRVGISEVLGYQRQENYFRVCPGVRIWQKEVIAQLNKSRIMTTPTGRRRIFFGRWGAELHKKAVSFVPQSVIADVLNEGLVKLAGLLREEGLDAQLLLQVHDEVDLQCWKKDLWMIRGLLKEAFDISINIKGRIIKIPFRIEVGSNWDNTEVVT